MAPAAATSAGAAHPRVEKKLMEEKIAKVREVVKNMSTNDIVLALHNYELDVERTIHAICEGGFESALGSWEKTGTVKKRNNKKKAKPGATLTMSASDGQSTGNLTKGTFGTTSSISSSISSAAYSNGFTSNNNNATTNFSAAASPYQPPLLARNNNGSSSIKLNGSPLTAAVNMKQPEHQQNGGTTATAMNMPFIQGGADKAPPPSVIAQQQTKDIYNGNTANENGSSSNTNAFASFADDSVTHLEQNKALFENEISYAHENVQRCFKEVHDALALREQQMLAELAECRRNGLAYFGARADEFKALNTGANNNNKQSKAFAAALEKFNAAKTDDLETALCARFLYDSAELSTLVGSVGQFGKVIPVVNAAPPPTIIGQKKEEHPQAAAKSALSTQQRRSNSPSSLVSSVDSGLGGVGGQISPVNQEKVAAVQPMAQVEEHGIVLKSSSISADQLAEIQRNIMDTLRAKGIDPGVMFAEMNSSDGGTSTAPRRRQPPHHHAYGRGGGGGGGSGNASGAGKQNQQQNHPHQHPQQHNRQRNNNQQQKNTNNNGNGNSQGQQGGGSSHNTKGKQSQHQQHQQGNNGQNQQNANANADNKVKGG